MEKDSKHTVLLAKRKASVRLPILQVKRDLLKNILNKKVCFRYAGKEIEFAYDVKISTERTNDGYYYHFVCNHALC
ncbi:hypothetical protein [Parablautia muri]|uniref:Uncharacterized protein n=1 Tax=Parablautia muri TaxID=2320879 RepID=A0A9X5BER9_9FIRM|nr:hypothetical protein [Parablautia muri]NBJ92405.1 hypothetical protein [Parablautia muri]